MLGLQVVGLDGARSHLRVATRLGERNPGFGASSAGRTQGAAVTQNPGDTEHGYERHAKRRGGKPIPNKKLLS